MDEKPKIENLPTPTEPSGQAILFDADTWQEGIIRRSEEARRVHTFKGMLEREPDRAEYILEQLQQGTAKTTIARIAKCSRNTVIAAARWMLERAENVEHLKRRSAATWGAIRDMAGERALEILADDGAKVSLRDLAILAGTAQDKELLLRGEATERIEVERVDASAEFNRRLEALTPEERERLQYIMSLPAESSRPKGPALPADFEEVPEAAADPADGAGNERQKGGRQ